MIQTLDQLISVFEDSNSISIEDYVRLRNRGKEALRGSEFWVGESDYVTGVCEVLQNLIEEKDKQRLDVVVAEFIQRYRKFEEEYRSCDRQTIDERRAQLDELAQEYCLVAYGADINNGNPRKSKTRNDKGIKAYIHQFNQRQKITEDFEQIKGIYERNKGENLRNLAKRRLIGGSRLNLTNVINAYRKISYQEGVVDAQELQGEILGHAKEYKDEIAVKINSTKENGFFCLSSHTVSIGYGPSNATYDIHQILTGQTGDMDWYDRLVSLTQKLKQLDVSHDLAHYNYIRAVEYGLQESLARGDLASLSTDSRYRNVITGAIGAVQNHLRYCEKIDFSTQSKLAMAV